VNQSIEIKSAVLHRVRVPFVEPFRISNGVVAEKDAILIELTTSDGVVGWGEASPMSGAFYSSDTPDSSWTLLKDQFVPALLSLGRIDAARLHEFMCEQPADHFSRAGIEGALWDVDAQTRGVALCTRFGIPPRPVPSGVAIGIFDTTAELLERVRRYVAAGYQRVKIKIQPGWDVEPVAAVRASFPDVPLMVDANAAYTLDDVKIFLELDRFQLMMIEQPLGARGILEAGELQAQLHTPLCADESAESSSSAPRELSISKCSVLVVSPERT
jgi:O-succinylbenzoate synthase